MSASHAFMDDSSGALGLGHNSYNGKGIAKLDADERAVIIAAQTIKREARISELHRQGFSIVEATKLAQEEYDNPQVTKPIEDRERKHIRSIEHLAGMDRKSPKPGSRGAKSKFKRAKTGTYTCPNCHLEECLMAVGCTPRRVKHRRGRPTSAFAGPRTKRGAHRVSDGTYAILQLAGINANDGLALLAISLRDRVPIEALVQEFVRLRPHLAGVA